MNSIIKRLVSSAAVAAALGGAAAVNASHAGAADCLFNAAGTGQMQFCQQYNLQGQLQGYAAYQDSAPQLPPGWDFLGAVDPGIAADGVNCRARIGYWTGAFRTTNYTTAFNTSAYVPGALPPGDPAQGWFPEAAGNQFPAVISIYCP